MAYTITIQESIDIEYSKNNLQYLHYICHIRIFLKNDGDFCVLGPRGGGDFHRQVLTPIHIALQELDFSKQRHEQRLNK
jgi:hypothetical protein